MNLQLKRIQLGKLDIYEHKPFVIFGEGVNNYYVYMLIFGAQLYLILKYEKQKIKVPPFPQDKDFLILLVNVKTSFLKSSYFAL